MQREVLIGFLDYCLENDLTIDQRIQLFMGAIQNQGIHYFNVEDLYTNSPGLTYSLDMAEEVLLENIDEVDSTLLEEEAESHQIWTNNAYIRIKEISVDIYEGDYCRYDEEDDNYMADFTIYIFKEMGTLPLFIVKDIVAYMAAVTNYCTQNDIEIKIDELKCEVVYK